MVHLFVTGGQSLIFFATGFLESGVPSVVKGLRAVPNEREKSWFVTKITIGDLCKLALS